MEPYTIKKAQEIGWGLALAALVAIGAAVSQAPVDFTDPKAQVVLVFVAAGRIFGAAAWNLIVKATTAAFGPPVPTDSEA